LFPMGEPKTIRIPCLIRCTSCRSATSASVANRLQSEPDARVGSGGDARRGDRDERLETARDASHRPGSGRGAEFIAKTLEGTRLVTRRDYVTPPEPVYQATTTGGEPYFSDSQLVLLELRTEDQPELRNVSEGTLPISMSKAASGLRRAGRTAADIARPGLAFKASAVERQ
jgi:hypothetical protein